MKLERKFFSKKELSEKERKHYEDLGIASGLLMSGTSAVDYLLARNVEKNFPGGIITSKGEKIKVDPNTIKNVKLASKFLIPTGLALTGLSAGMKWNRKRNKTNSKKDNEDKA